MSNVDIVNAVQSDLMICQRYNNSPLSTSFLFSKRPALNFQVKFGKVLYFSLQLQLTYNTRHSKDLQIPRYRTEFAKKGFHYAALKIWNDTPAEIRELPTLYRFKNN